MPRDSRLTRERLFQAATEEFAAHGIAGARIDRMAETAGYNKGLLYVHLGNKDQMFDTVFEAAVLEIQEAVPFRADDLPGYAGALFDFHLAHPHLMRLVRWHNLERDVPVAQIAAVVERTQESIQAVSAAQAQGLINGGLSAQLLVSMVISIATTWTDGSPEPLTQDASPEQIAARRHAVVLAVGRLVAPPTP
jgi:AcrR family transcriptional regulator